MRLPEMTGGAHVALAATVYVLIGVNGAPGVALPTISSPLSFSTNNRSPDRVMAALPAWRGSDSHIVLPVFASAQKNWPLLSGDNEKMASPTMTALLNDIWICGFSHARSAAHFPPVFAMVYALSGIPCPDTMRVLVPYTSGVIEFVVDRDSNGTLHSSCPLDALTPTRLFCENTIT